MSPPVGTKTHVQVVIEQICTTGPQSLDDDEWLQFDFGAELRYVVGIRTRCRYSYNQCVKSYQIQYWQNESWLTSLDLDGSVMVSASMAQ